MAKAFELLRKLGNAIYSAPSPRYARLALNAAVEIGDKVDDHTVYQDVSLALILAIPVAHENPDETVDLLANLRQAAIRAGVTEHFVEWIDRSLSNLE